MLKFQLIVDFITALLDQVERSFFDFLIGVTTRERYRLCHIASKNRHQKPGFHIFCVQIKLAAVPQLIVVTLIECFRCLLLNTATQCKLYL